MFPLANVSIRSRLLLLMAPLSIMFLAAGIFAAYEMHRIDASYVNMLNHQARALKHMARSSQRMTRANQLLFEAISEHREEMVNRLEAEMDGLDRDYRSSIEGALKASPDHAGPIGEILGMYEKFHAAARLVRIKIRAQADAEALGLMRTTVQPYFRMTREESVRLVDELERNMDQASAGLSADTHQDIVITLAALLAGLGLSLAVALGAIGRPIVQALLDMRDSIRDVAEGRLDKAIPRQDQHNEFGEIGRALATLQQVAREREIQTWVKAQVADLATRIQAAGDFQDFSSTLLSGLAPSIGLLSGALYLEDGGRGLFVRAGGFALNDPGAETVFAPGQGLVGQCARDARPLECSTAEQDGPRILTGLGEVRALHLTLLPVTAQNSPLAVLELATAAPLSGRAKALVEAILPTVALNAEILKNSLATRELLEKTQIQAETLAVSENQLRARKEELQEEQRRLRAIVDNLPSMIILKDAESRHLMVNAFYVQATGIPAERIEGRLDHEIFPPDVARNIVEMDRKAMTQGSPLTFEEEVPHPDGTAHSYQVTKVPLTGEGGRVTGLVVLATDITPRKRLEERLANQLTFQQALVDTIPYPVFYKGADTRFLGFNRAYEDCFSVRREDLTGKRVLDLDYLPEEDRTAYQAEDEEVIATAGRVRKEMPIPFADGQIHQTLYFVAGFRLADGSPGGLVGTFVDITERKRAEEEARMAQAEMTQIFNTAAGGMRVIGLDHTVLKANDAYLAMTGFTREEVEGRRCSDRFGGSACSSGECPLERILAGEERVEFTTRKRRKDGLEIFCDLAAPPTPPRRASSWGSSRTSGT